MLSRPKPEKQKENRTLEASYEKVARNSTIEGTQDEIEDELAEDEENKIGDTQTERNSDMRYDIEAILENSICPKFDKSKIYNWYTARFYSVIDILGHPMHRQAKMVLSRHLQRLKAIEDEHRKHNPENELSSSSEGESSSSDDEEFDIEMRARDRLRLEGSAQKLPKPQPGATMNSGSLGQARKQPSKEDVMKQYRNMLAYRNKQFEAMEAGLTTEDEKKEFNKEKERFFKHLEAQKDEMLRRVSGDSPIHIPAQAEGHNDEGSFHIDDDSDEAEDEGEEEELEESKEENSEQQQPVDSKEDKQLEQESEEDGESSGDDPNDIPAYNPSNNQPEENPNKEGEE